MSNKSGTSNQIISLPQGERASHEIGEMFLPDLNSGTDNFSMPIALSSGRNAWFTGLAMVMGLSSWAGD